MSRMGGNVDWNPGMCGLDGKVEGKKVDTGVLFRIEEYLGIEQEAVAVVEERRPPVQWPSKGAISVKNLEMRSALLDERGAGKSSFSLSLFRMVEPTQGSITIDGINISDIGLRDLRSRLTIIPQDPVLFAGTVRSNMDPFSEYNDATIWTSLEKVHILETMQTASGDGEGGAALTLDSVVVEGGVNFSQGQRQLLCLARALLRSSKVALLDEATASVDNETDAKIQKTLRGPDFADVTVYPLRIVFVQSLISNDYIIVLDKGMVAQIGKPYELLQQKHGIFRSMCEESGEYAELEQMAMNA
ncbi:P-loop containing nucleoside triphosphate hydrolase protein [Chytridium lagenaria]|nr:P-loop containing nucleoside triphosphate hydrolase protein [Chytridium lagenaria]